MASLTNSPFALSRATESGLLEVLDLQYDAFPPILQEVFMGTPVRWRLPEYCDLFMKETREDLCDIWIKGIDVPLARSLPRVIGRCMSMVQTPTARRFGASAAVA